jgi:hypothetical protein
MTFTGNLFHFAGFVKPKPHARPNLSREHSPLVTEPGNHGCLFVQGMVKKKHRSMEMAMMPHQPVAILRIMLVVYFAGLLSASLPATPCRGSDSASADRTITLNVQNEPLRSVLGKISKTTGWKIKAPDKWMDKPITQTLNSVSIEEGLRFILKDAGLESLLLTYDEDRKTITVYDTESRQGQSANRPAAQGDALPPVVSASDRPDPMLERPTKNAGAGPSQGTTRARKKRQAHTEEE